MLLAQETNFPNIFETSSIEESFQLYETSPLLPIFEEVKLQLFPTYKYLQGNCHCTAHFAAMVLDAYGITQEKVWLFAPCRYDFSSKDAIIVHDKNALSPTGVIRWGYHVANVVHENGQKWVFDFGLSENKPLLFDEWIHIFNLPSFHLEFQKWQHYLFFNEEIELRNGKKKSLFSGNFFAYEGESQEDNWLEKGLAINETAYQFFRNEVEHLDNEVLLNDYKVLVGSINNFECVFKNNAENTKMNPIFQEKHQLIIEKYRAIYAKNIAKWLEKVEIWSK